MKQSRAWIRIRVPPRRDADTDTVPAAATVEIDSFDSATYTDDAADILRENLAGATAGANAADRDANVKAAAMAVNFMVDDGEDMSRGGGGERAGR